MAFSPVGICDSTESSAVDIGAPASRGQPSPPSRFEVLRGCSVARAMMGVIAALLAFSLIGTLAAVWENPFFYRMTPVQGFEPTLLALMSALFGLFVALPRSNCGKRAEGLGGILGFIGIACPICNKALLFVIGSEFLLAYLEPNRIWLALLGTGLMLFAVVRKVRSVSKRCDSQAIVQIAAPVRALLPSRNYSDL